MARLGTIAGGVGVSTTLQINYLPEILHFIVALPPTSIVINVLGDGVTMNLDTAGIAEVDGYKQFGTTANQTSLIMANGLIEGKNVEITVVNNGVPAFDLFGYSEKKGNAYLIYQRQTILANSGVEFNAPFVFLAVTAPGATDQFTLSMKDGTVENALREDIQANQNYFQNNVAPFLINNWDSDYRKVYILPAAQRTAYLGQWKRATGILNIAPISRTRAG